MSCSICLDSLFSGNAGPACLPCGHSFHHACLREWFPSNGTCPQCRQHTTEQDVRLIYFNSLDSPESKELEIKLNELSLNVQAEDIALQTLTDNIQQLSEQVAYIQENEMSNRTLNKKNTELMEKIYAHVTKNDQAIKVLAENYSSTSTAKSSLLQENQEKIAEEDWYSLIFLTLAIFCVLLLCLVLFWTFYELKKPDKAIPCKHVFIRHTKSHFVNICRTKSHLIKIHQPSFLDPVIVKKIVAELQSTKPTPRGMFKSITAVLTDAVQMLYNLTMTDNV